MYRILGTWSCKVSGEAADRTQLLMARRFSATAARKRTRQPSSLRDCIKARSLQDYHHARRLPRPNTGRFGRDRAAEVTRWFGTDGGWFVYTAPFDLDEVEKRIDESTAAIMLEPIQGEGGVKIPTREYLHGLRKIADEHGLLLIFDEVQTVWTHRRMVRPSILWRPTRYHDARQVAVWWNCRRSDDRQTVDCRQLAGWDACEHVWCNPIAAAAGIAMIETIEADGLLAMASQNAALFGERLAELASRFPQIREVRQAGLMIGIEIRF